MARATAATELVSRALQADDGALSGGAANQILDGIGELQLDLRGLAAELVALRSHLDTLGPATVAVEHIVAYWVSRDPASRELGQMPEMLEQRLVCEMNRVGPENWSVLHEGRVTPNEVGGKPPVPQLRGAIEKKLLYWEAHARPNQREQVQVSPNKERRIRSFAVLNRCRPGVALEALLDLALSAAGEPGVPESQAVEIESALIDIRTALGGLRTQLATLALDLGLVGQLVAGLAPLISLLCAQDSGIRHSRLPGRLVRMEPEELYTRLSAYVCTHALSQWQERLRGLGEAEAVEGEPTDNERLRPPCREDRDHGGAP